MILTLSSVIANNESYFNLALDLNSKEFKVSQNIYYFWSENLWSPYQKTDYSYSNEFLESATTYSWATTSESWIFYSRTEYYYSNGKIVQLITQVYNDSIWVNHYKCEYFYDQDKISYFLVYAWLDPEWSIQSRSIYTYPDEYHYNMVTQYPGESGWIDSYRIFFETDSGGNIIEYLYQRYDSDVWVNNQKISYNYPLGRLRDYTFFLWNGNEWDNHSWHVYYYDTSGLNNRTEVFEWASSEWQPDYKDDNIFDTNMNMTETICQYYESGSWRNSSRFTYSYLDVSDIDVLLAYPADIGLNQNYPNPFNPETEISFSLKNDSQITLELYNTSGQLVKILYEGKLSAGHHKTKFDSRDLESGIYFYTLRSGTNAVTKKMTIIK